MHKYDMHKFVINGKNGLETMLILSLVKLDKKLRES